MKAGETPALITPAPAPMRGETILIRRPGAPDIRMRFMQLNTVNPAPEPGWLWLYGEILEGLPTPAGWTHQTLYARPVERGVYEMTGVRG
ncbi:hypothetical protein Aph02nite_17420 [Actinoplanes philippinensis]|uniref:Uncharacterized protein n=1 Tax=Actinoplanes philippinensis TaxID=35752 RepID=A0A1I2BAU2_9ACTN|nr:hypothetical protein [Actinoplanes philippinensis]GIE75792.1 hypothetical protein Aph02nite_17420 [Actinoplanes philippinensis]SFE53097.1 hypothetical protein SAMN05421541_102206 [Actinoplanes philippinensis]